MNNVTSENYKKRLRSLFDGVCENLLEQAEIAIKRAERMGYHICYVNEIQGKIELPGGKKAIYECKYASVPFTNDLDHTWMNSIKDKEHDILVLHTPLNYRSFLLGDTDKAKYYTLYAVVHTEDN